MSKKYDPKTIEPKWQKYWEERGMYRAEDFSKKPKRYVLDMFPYPSGEGLHVGHPLGYIATDVFSRYSRMKGFNVLHPMGWDAFGLPAENYAIQNKIHPKVAVEKNIARFKEQLGWFGFSYDWSREINTTDPAYYRWTQWIFLKLFERGLAYQADVSVNFCPKDKTGLANEEVVDGKCERCGSTVERRMMRQWLLKITDYADRLLEDLETLDWPGRIKEMQRNWIGRSEGVEIDFPLKGFTFDKALLATNNPSKLKRVRMLLEGVRPALEIMTPKDLGIEAVDVEEGSDLFANAEAKARAYFGKTDLPVLGLDSGLFLEGVPNDPAKVKRSALGDLDEKALTSEEIGKRMFEYYRDLAARRGGAIPGYYLDVFALVLPDGSVRTSEARRDLVLTDKSRGNIDHHFPLRTLYKIVATGKYVGDQTEKEERTLELAAYGRALRELLRPTIRVFTTRPDTLFGATYVVLAPEHEFLEREISNLKSQIPNKLQIEKYVNAAKQRSELERQEIGEKSGVKIEGLTVLNPLSGEELPAFVAEYVLGHYGTGAIMAVPAHDERDFEFANKHNLPSTIVVCPHYPETICPILDTAYTGEGHLVGSGEFDGLPSAEARKKIIEKLEKEGRGKRRTTYRLRDWVFSRQRFWGEPIPLVFCEACKKRAENSKSEFLISKSFDTLRIPSDAEGQIPNLKFPAFVASDATMAGRQNPNSQLSAGELLNPGWVEVPEEQLPVELPEMKSYEPTGTGESPLAAINEWVNTTCPRCGGPARRETNTMPQWAGSCWYYLRFIDPHNHERFVDPAKEKYWLAPSKVEGMPSARRGPGGGGVDLYLGGAEHAVLHLLYARFWHKALFDAGLISTPEPFRKLFNQGMILGPDHQKMSKSRGNVINPDEVIEQYGADTLRLYEMFMGPLSDEKPWDTHGIIGLWRFLNRVYDAVTQIGTNRKANQHESDALERIRHRSIRKVTEDIEAMKFNTAIAALMEYTNEISKSKAPTFAKAPAGTQNSKDAETLVLLLAPFAPHLAEELWSSFAKASEDKKSVHEQPWPIYDAAVLEEENVTIVIQVNGRARGQVIVHAGATEIEVRAAAEAEPRVAKYLQNASVERTIFVQDRLMNFVISP